MVSHVRIAISMETIQVLVVERIEVEVIDISGDMLFEQLEL